ncbi:MAG: PASTA domain-containing protein [Clostridia bacterium]|nr:PASTA domain-containing protein [Clostridia bacterium]
MLHSIAYAEIVGIRMAQEGSGGYTVNSTCYSVLLFGSNGSVDLIEGDANAIRPYLRYMRPHNDEVSLNRFGEKLKKDLNEIIDAKINKVYNAAFPLPDVKNMAYEEAKKMLEEFGFTVELKNPKKEKDAKGLVIECYRKDNTIRTAVVRLGYLIPDVSGLSPDDAIQVLEGAGFTVTVKTIRKEGYADKTVIGAEYADDGDRNLYLLQNDMSNSGGATSETTFLYEIRNKASVSEIYDVWDSYDLGIKYKNIDSYIKMKMDFEKKVGVPKNIEEIKNVIEGMLQKQSDG